MSPRTTTAPAAEPTDSNRMTTTTFSLRITFLTTVLGTQPQKDVATEYITSKVADANGNLPEDEVGTLPQELEKGTTAFHKLDDGTPIYYDYQVKGFLKEAAQVFNGHRGLKNMRSKMDNLVFVKPRQIRMVVPDPLVPPTMLERPLRAMTAQGPRTSLARSEELPVGTYFECTLKVYSGAFSEALLRDLLSYGADKGLGQWRNGGHGQFEFELTALD